MGTVSYHLANPETGEITLSSKTIEEAQMYQKMFGLGGWIIVEDEESDEH